MNSNNNQPRNISGSTDLHNATDLRGSAGTQVYSILNNGQVTAISNPGTVNNGYITVRYTIDGLNYYIRYFHINPSSNLTVGTQVTQNTVLGEVDIMRGQGWAPHLDIGEKSASPTGHSIKLYRFFRQVSDWEGGAQLDFFSGDAITASINTLYINCINSTTSSQQPCSSVTIHYKVGINGTWSSASLSQNSSQPTRWSVNLGNLANSGQTIYYYLVGRRTDISTYNWAYFPQYYTYPSGPTLPTNRIATIQRSYTIN